MGNALITIRDWFSNSNVKKSEIKNYLRKSVICLWYELDLTKNNSVQAEITLFSRVNMGKIPLSVSELLKAILLKKKNIDYEHIDDKNDNPKLVEQIAENQQYQRAVQWDRMEQTLSDDSFFRFIYAEKKAIEPRMDYLFFLEYLLENNTNEIPDEKEIFRYYEKKINNSKNQAEENLWENLSRHFSLLQEWYNDRIAFHKIGFIVATNNTSSAITLRDLIISYNSEEIVGKSDFYRTELNNIIKIILRNRLCSKGKDFYIDDLDGLTYESNKSELQVVLLFFNILTAMKSPDYRFAFEYVYPLEEGGSLEHIFPQTPKIEDIVKSFSKEEYDSDVPKKEKKEYAIQAFVEAVEKEFSMIGKKAPDRISIDSDDSLRDWWSSVLRELNITEEAVQGIGNIALISKNLNTRLTNNMFFAKQNKIKQFDKEGKFIPICTHNVFLKYYSIKDEKTEKKTSGIFWEMKDMENHKNNIKNMLSDYLPKRIAKEGVNQ